MHYLVFNAVLLVLVKSRDQMAERVFFTYFLVQLNGFLTDTDRDAHSSQIGMTRAANYC